MQPYCVWVLSLSLFPSFIDVVTLISTSFLSIAEYTITWTYHILSSHYANTIACSSKHQFGRVHLLAAVNSATMNICI